MHLWHKRFADLLNVVVVVKTNLQTGATAHVVLFSRDLELASDKLVEYYRLRFQIEFNFRDAKQYWGLEDFMTVNPTPTRYKKACKSLDKSAPFLPIISHPKPPPRQFRWQCDFFDLAVVKWIYKITHNCLMYAQFVHTIYSWSHGLKTNGKEIYVNMASTLWVPKQYSISRW
jgi:hypothetical protein